MKLVTKKQRPNPLTTEIFKDITLAVIDGDSLEDLMSVKDEDLITLHSNFGRWIRNSFILGESNKNFMDKYPNECIDEVSFEIITNIHKMWHDLRKDGTDLYKLFEKPTMDI